MNDSLKALIEALRQELQQYGEMLARLDHQQDSIMRRAPDDVLASVTSIQQQGEIIQSARQAREQSQRELARQLNQPDHTSLLELSQEMPPDYRPLIRALVDENNQLLARVQQRARQNHVLLRRSLDLMQDLLRSLFPPAQRGGYNGSGRLLGAQLPASVFCDAAG